MGYTLSTEELFTLAEQVGERTQARELQKAQDTLAAVIASRLGVEALPQDPSEPDAYVVFASRTPGQPIPEALAGFDNAERWDFVAE